MLPEGIDPKDLLLSSYDYHLPEELIASRPAPNRHTSKLLVYNAKDDTVTHTSFLELDKFLPSGAQIVFNQSKVFPCRLVGKKPTGGKAEIFVLSVVDVDGSYPCLIKSRGKKDLGDTYLLDGDVQATITWVEEGRFGVSFNIDSQASSLANYLEEYGKIPIPPYIRGGESDDLDKKDYQTVYAKEVGSVAAPTAGLHFSDEVFSKLEKKNIDRAYVTLHVGLGTFAPVKTENVLDHDMHTEQYFVDQQNLERLEQKRPRFCVGTTSLRVLESSFKSTGFDLEADKRYQTNIFLHPGKDVKSIDGLITNFHLPKSTLLMLVSSLIGREKTLELYKIAIENEYRFFSYGDAMLILR
ncbi:tRNA preQ1(34) S-adenosylmethionine ribosyltransferase-isomerase QueA [Halobacteriovorax sp. GB3]|uniref:tRNA preQ1(34) S-adenosylmethionine ribosyltransferase-isomerase QueA n=1 Tax=Halobacteriovorax sp. GB3 TaxID=2719615 RepID=UPI0023605969|nr:tRNA preQ1(34) S-adenosylmethionine ribosyltransferase-isomerase QueA [Halobacteriovorax sp. GB3]MDD0852754.1 tRNA preQ1(34) S-adenosylmethionine ribosyltransferase-isomerase QueA [Halobacteriovorax sp. GB3]